MGGVVGGGEELTLKRIAVSLNNNFVFVMFLLKIFCNSVDTRG